MNLSPSSTTIFSLPDDCWFIILDFIDLAKTVFSISLSSKDLSRTMKVTNFTNVKFKLRKTPEEPKKGVMNLEISGWFLKVFDENRNFFCDLEEFFPDLKSLTLHSCGDLLLEDLRMIGTMRLEEFEMEGLESFFKLDWNWHRRGMKTFGGNHPFSYLKSLKLVNENNFRKFDWLGEKTGCYYASTFRFPIDDFPKLEKFVLDYKRRNTTNNISLNLRNLPMLKHCLLRNLDFDVCIHKNCLCNLESLKMYNCDDLFVSVEKWSKVKDHRDHCLESFHFAFFINNDHLPSLKELILTNERNFLTNRGSRMRNMPCKLSKNESLVKLVLTNTFSFNEISDCPSLEILEFYPNEDTQISCIPNLRSVCILFDDINTETCLDDDGTFVLPSKLLRQFTNSSSRSIARFVVCVEDSERSLIDLSETYRWKGLGSLGILFGESCREGYVVICGDEMGVSKLRDVGISGKCLLALSVSASDLQGLNRIHLPRSIKKVRSIFLSRLPNLEKLNLFGKYFTAEYLHLKNIGVKVLVVVFSKCSPDEQERLSINHSSFPNLEELRVVDNFGPYARAKNTVNRITEICGLRKLKKITLVGWGHLCGGFVGRVHDLDLEHVTVFADFLKREENYLIRKRKPRRVFEKREVSFLKYLENHEKFFYERGSVMNMVYKS